MRCQVINQFNRRGEVQHPGSIIDVPEDMILKMEGYVQPLEKCEALKTGGRKCGSPLKAGLNGHWSCSDMSCQVPATKYK